MGSVLGGPYLNGESYGINRDRYTEATARPTPVAVILKISLLTGGGDRPYALGLLSCLLSRDIEVEFVGSDELFEPALMKHPKVVFLNLRGDQSPGASSLQKAVRVLQYYVRLARYASRTNSGIFHILWLNKFIYFDRTVMNCYYKVLGKRVVHTAHNIDQQERDGESTFLNRLTLKIMYRLMDHIFVHTDMMKRQLVAQFKVPDEKVSVIPFGINNTVPESGLTKTQARRELGLADSDKVLLFFGNIAPYKGLEYLVMAMPTLKEKIGRVKLIIAGRIKDCESYWGKIQSIKAKYKLEDTIIERVEFIPEEEIEVYYKASDVLILPYKYIFQSGVLFLSYNFGLPVIATDVGSLRDDIVEGKTGFICNPMDTNDLTDKIVKYYNSCLYNNLELNSCNIVSFAREKYSWNKVSHITVSVYERLFQ